MDAAVGVDLAVGDAVVTVTLTKDSNIAKDVFFALVRQSPYMRDKADALLDTWEKAEAAATDMHAPLTAEQGKALREQLAKLAPEAHDAQRREARRAMRAAILRERVAKGEPCEDTMRGLACESVEAVCGKATPKQDAPNQPAL